MNPEEVVPMFIRRKDLKRVVGLSPSTVVRLEEAGKFPARIRIGGSVGWLKPDVEAFFQGQKQLNRYREICGKGNLS